MSNASSTPEMAAAVSAKSYKTSKACVDGNWAVANAAYRMNDCAFIFPITPSSPMGEFSDEFATKHQKNIFGQEMKIVEMQVSNEWVLRVWTSAWGAVDVAP